MIKKVILITLVISSYLAFQKTWFALSGPIVILLLGYEQYVRSKLLKQRRATMVGKLKTRLLSLPYSELEFNKVFLTVLPSQKLRETVFSHKLNATSTLINYKDGLRKTSFVLPNQIFGPKIYLFGNSTIDCQEVPDDYTIASQLQKRVNASTHPLNGYEVKNLGVHAFSIKDNFAHFQKLSIDHNDIVVFFFGAIETFFPADIFDFKFSRLLKIHRFYNLSKSLQIRSLTRFLGKFKTFDNNHEIFADRLKDVDRIFMSINSRCSDNGAKFVAILQPFLHTRFPITEFDKADSYFYPKSARFRAALYLFAEFVARFENKSYFIDGSGLFDSYTDSDVYIDWVHTNFLGCEIISDYFYSVIQQKFFDN